MGCGPSKNGNVKDLRLSGSNLNFSYGQLQALNIYFSEIIDSSDYFTKDPGKEKNLVVIERLMQRLICGVGILDSRFSSKFLVSLKPFKVGEKPGNSLSYLVRLDELSLPYLYSESDGPACDLVEQEGCPQGFSKIRLTGPGCEQWAEFISNKGFLRRDKVQERFVELLAASAGRNLINRVCDVDESRLCGSPGKVVDATHLQLLSSSTEQVFYGANENSKKFPDPRDFRIAIVEGCSCVRLRVGMVYSTDFGVETDIEGFYMVPAPPHPTLRCEDRPATWQIRFPAAEQLLLKHYAPNSLPSRVLAVLRALEEITNLKDWTHDHLSLHVLTIADRLVSALKTQRHPSYFFPWFNIMLNSPGGGTLHYTEEDYNHDAELLSYQLRQFTDIAPCFGETDPWRRVETAMINKWSQVLIDLTPPQSTRGTRMSFYPLSSSGYSTIAASQYSIRQLTYIGQLLRSMLIVRSLTYSKAIPWLQATETNSNTEDLIYLVSSILEQAKYSFGPKLPKKKSNKIKTFLESYDSSANQLLVDIRSDKKQIDSSDDNVVVREVLKWLYFGLDKDRKRLAPILRPYLAKLFTASHENCLYVSEWKRRQETDELESLRKFVKLVNKGNVDVNQGIADAFHKGWSWAESIIKTSSQLADGVELVFTPYPLKVIRHKVIDSQVDLNKGFSTSRSLGRKPMNKQNGFSTATFPRNANPYRECLKSRLQRSRKDDELLTTSHNILKNASPMTQIAEMGHRYGNHRGIGSIVHSLITLRKFSVLQEVCSILPESDRAQILDEVQRVSKEVRKPKRLARTISARTKPTQIYRSTNELSMPQPEEDEQLNGTLMGTCRQLRNKTSHPSVFNPAFFRSPETEAISPVIEPPKRIGKLSTESEMMFLMKSTRNKHNIKRSEVTTNL